MKARCNNTFDQRYAGYGALGVRVCERWQNDLLAFAEDMGPRPGPEYSIDRIDPAGPYSPENCRWADAYTQNRNKRDTLFVTIGGYSRVVPEWLEILGISRNVFTNRRRSGMSALDALTAPILHPIRCHEAHSVASESPPISHDES
jgi:hypothetical protein